jgi:hypothetical protein
MDERKAVKQEQQEQEAKTTQQFTFMFDTRHFSPKLRRKSFQLQRFNLSNIF